MCAENVSHLPCFGILWQHFFLKNRAFIELLVILGSQSSWLVILWELGVFMSMLSARRVCDDTFKIWISPSCFYTRTPHLTLLKVSLRWGRKLSLSPLQLPGILCSCHPTWLSLPLFPSLSTRHTYYSPLPAPRCKLKTAPRGERRRDTRVPFCYQIWQNNEPPPPAHFTCMSREIKSESANFCCRFPWSGCNVNSALYKYGWKVHLRKANWIENLLSHNC